MLFPDGVQGHRASPSLAPVLKPRVSPALDSTEIIAGTSRPLSLPWFSRLSVVQNVLDKRSVLVSAAHLVTDTSTACQKKSSPRLWQVSV